MAIYLTTGKPGSYKSASTLETALKLQQERPVYLCNFRGLKDGSFDVIDHFSDWVDVPDGSAVFIDECQEFTRDVPSKLTTEQLPKWMTLLEKHRHRGIDIYLVTQHPMFIHPHIRRLLEKHTHFQRSQGLPYAMKREWPQVCNEPEDIRNAKGDLGCTVSTFRPDKKVFDYYESTVIDTHKLKIPKKLIFMISIISVLVLFAVYMGFGFFSKILSNEVPNGSQTQSQSSKTAEGEHRLSSTPLNPQSDYYKDFDYNPSDPFKSQSYKYPDTPSDYPVLVGCIEFDNTCSCFTQQGTRLLDMNPKACYKIIKEGLPFNPYASAIKSNSNEFRPLQQPEYTETHKDSKID